MATRKLLPKEIRKKETPEEKKARYLAQKKENIDKARRQRKKEIKDNNTANRRLAFLTNIFAATNHNNSDMAKLVGTTQQAMSWYFSVKDDCRLTLAKKFLDAIGLTLEVKITKNQNAARTVDLSKKKTGVNQGVKFAIEGNLTETPWINPKMPSYINECTPDKNLYFLAQYLPTCGMQITALMESCNIDMTSLRYAFAKDDIKISQIFNIAAATGGEITWIVNKK